METVVRNYTRCDINVVVGVGDGLVHPVVKDAGSKGVKAISDEVRALVDGAQEGTLAAEDCASGTFTILNLGMYGVKSAQPIVSQPQVG